MGSIQSQPPPPVAQSKLKRLFGKPKKTQRVNANSILTNSQYLQMKKKGRRTIQLILLGSGESGKSTLLRQVRNLYFNGFTDEFKNEMKPHIIRNVLEGCMDILQVVVDPEELTEDDSTLAKPMKVLNIAKNRLMDDMVLTPEIVEAILGCLAEERFLQLAESREFYLLQDSWLALASKLKNYPEWGGNDWLPSTEDILHSRIRTSAIEDVCFQVNSFLFKMTDVSGQLHYRNKYLISRYLDGVDVVLYVQSLSEYNLKMFEDKDEDRFTDSLELWTKVANNKILSGSRIVLFFNKLDIFKIKYLENKFPLPLAEGFRPPPKVEDEQLGSVELAKEWYTELYLSRILKKSKANKDVLIHFTTAVDEEIMKPTIEQVTKDTIYKVVSNSGLVKSI